MKNKGVCILDDLINPSGEILSFAQFKGTFKVKATYLDYLGLLSSLPKNWRAETKKTKHQRPIIHPFVAFVLQKKRGAKLFYDKFVELKYRDNVNK